MAYHFYLATEGARQGQFTLGSPNQAPSGKPGGKIGKGVSAPSPRLMQADWTSEIFKSAVLGPVSGSTGKPPKITITKQKDSASPELLQTLCNNEILQEVHLHYRRGRQKYVLKLTNAAISSIKPAAIVGATVPCEQVEFSPERIENVLDFSR
jgi:type VI secretion system Hcp family effector